MTELVKTEYKVYFRQKDQMWLHSFSRRPEIGNFVERNVKGKMLKTLSEIFSLQ